MNKRFRYPSYKAWLFLFFFLFLFGISNIGGYGRPIDEPPEQEILLMNITEYSEMAGIAQHSSIFNGIQRISESIEQDHGIASYYLFTPILLLTGKETTSSVYAWHIYTYMIWFLGVIALFQILKEIYRNRWTPIAGTLIYFFTPRMYAEGHYNNKDIVLLSLVYIMLAFAVRVLKKWKMADIIGFAVASGFLMNCKIIGIAIWGLTGLFAIGYTLRISEKKNYSRCFSDLTLAAISSLIIYFLLTPAMWRSPVSYIQYCLSNATVFSRWGKTFLFHGEVVKPIATGVPRTYVIQWMLMTTPVYVSMLFLVSMVIFIKDMTAKRMKTTARVVRADSGENTGNGTDGNYTEHSAMGKIENGNGNRNGRYFYLLFILTFLFPLAVSVIKAPTLILYNGWRHNYYLYAYIILCACYGIDRILDELVSLKKELSAKKMSMRLYNGLITGIFIAFGYIFTCADMLAHRSFEYMYFNPVARVLVDVKGFEGDYWNVAVLPTMKEFADMSEDEISIAPVGYAADGQLTNVQLKNLRILTEDENPDYYLFNTCMMIDRTELLDYEKVFSFQKYGRELCAIFSKIGER